MQRWRWELRRVHCVKTVCVLLGTIGGQVIPRNNGPPAPQNGTALWERRAAVPGKGRER